MMDQKNLSCVHAVILNTHARGGAGQSLWKKFLQSPEAKAFKFQDANRFDVATMTDSQSLFGNLTQWIRQCILQGCRNFVAVGGDGTVNLAVNALYEFIEFEPILGAVGLGSSNDFHKPVLADKRVRISKLPCRLAFQSAFKHDLGEVVFGLQEQASSKTLFVINASFGFVAETNLYFNRNLSVLNGLKRISVNTAIFYSAVQQFFKFKSNEVQIQIDGNAVQPVELINSGIVKNVHFAGDFRYDQPQRPDDEWFGFYLFGQMQALQKKHISKMQMIKTFFALLNGKFHGLPNTLSTQCQKCSFFSSAPIALETDGEVRPVTYAHFHVLPRKLLICP